MFTWIVMGRRLRLINRCKATKIEEMRRNVWHVPLKPLLVSRGFNIFLGYKLDGLFFGRFYINIVT